MIALDTHVVVWLHAGEVDRFPVGVRTKLDREVLGISPMVLLELQYLYETSRITVQAEKIFKNLSDEIGLLLWDKPFADIAREAIRHDWTRDPFDRMICAHASVSGHTLITKDRHIRGCFPAAFWDEGTGDKV